VKLAWAVNVLVGLKDVTTKVTVYVPLVDLPVLTLPNQLVVLPVSNRLESGFRPEKDMPAGEIVAVTESPNVQPVTLTVNSTRVLIASYVAEGASMLDAAIAGAAPTPITIGTAHAVPATTFRRLSFEGESSLRSFRSVILVPFWRYDVSAHKEQRTGCGFVNRTIAGSRPLASRNPSRQ